jgi:hypothetical protein
VRLELAGRATLPLEIKVLMAADASEEVFSALCDGDGRSTGSSAIGETFEQRIANVRADLNGASADFFCERFDAEGFGTHVLLHREVLLGVVSRAEKIRVALRALRAERTKSGGNNVLSTVWHVGLGLAWGLACERCAPDVGYEEPLSDEQRGQVWKLFSKLIAVDPPMERGESFADEWVYRAERGLCDFPVFCDLDNELAGCHDSLRYIPGPCPFANAALHDVLAGIEDLEGARQAVLELGMLLLPDHNLISSVYALTSARNLTPSL